MSHLTPRLLLLLGLLQAAPGAEAVQLRYRFTPGEVATYRTMLAAAGQSRTPFTPAPFRMQMRVDLISAQRILSVAPNGSARLETRNLSGSSRVSAAGRTETSRVTPEVTLYVLTDRGRLLSYREKPDPKAATQAAEADPEAATPGAGPLGWDNSDPLKALFGLNFPNRDVQPGERWFTETKVDVGRGQSIVVKIASQLVAVAPFRGRRCARIRTTFEMPAAPDASLAEEEEGITVEQDGKVTGQITSYFDLAEGREIYTDGWVVLLSKMSMAAPVDPTGATETAEMSSVMKMNLRQTFLKAVAPASRAARPRGGK